MITLQEATNGNVTFDEVKAFEGTEHFGRLKAAFLRNHLKVCHSVARFNKRKTRQHEYDELVNESYFGLERAFQDYDPEKGEFSTYATWWANNAVRSLIKAGRVVEVKPHVIDTYCQIKRLEESGYSQEQVQHKLNLSEKEYNKVVAFMRPIASINFKINAEGQEAEIEDDKNNPVTAAEQREILEAVATATASLNPRERKILDMRYRFENTLEQISERVGVSVERVRQILVACIKKLQGKLQHVA